MSNSQFLIILGTIWISSGTTFGSVAGTTFAILSLLFIYFEWKK